MSDENLTPEELPIEDQKKAINLQDLIYVKKYIDDNHYDKAETETLISSAVVSETETIVKENCYTKSEIDENHYTKTEIDENHYNRTETDETFYKRTDTVDNATNAVLKADGTFGGFTLDENGVLKFGDIVIPQKKVLYDDKTGQRIIDLTSFNLQAGDKLEIIIKSEEKTDTYGSISTTWEEHKMSTQVILGTTKTDSIVSDVTIPKYSMKALLLYKCHIYFDTYKISTMDYDLYPDDAGYVPETTGQVQMLGNVTGDVAADGGNPDVRHAIWDFGDDKIVYDSFLNMVITKVTLIRE